MERGCIVPRCERRFYAKGYCNAHYIAARKYPGESPEQLAGRTRDARSAEEVIALILSRGIETNSGCQEWTGATDHHGYGNIRWRGKLWGVHRLFFILTVEAVPPEIEVCHSCDNPPCFRAGHLFAGTHRENLLDAAVKGKLVGNGNRIGALNGRAKLTDIQVAEIRRRSTGRRGEQTEMAAEFGVSQTTIWKIVRGRTYV